MIGDALHVMSKLVNRLNKVGHLGVSVSVVKGSLIGDRTPLLGR